MADQNTDARAGDGKPAQNWEGAEEWMPLAWELCANECGEDACTELIWEGGPIPEPWGDRWLKYEDQAKEMIAMVRKHVPAAAAPAAPAQRVCHMECDGCISSGKCAHAEKARRDADHDAWMNDYFTLLGDAEIRHARGEKDMPAYLLDLAERIAKTHLDDGYVQRISELRATHFQAPATAEGSQP